MKLLFVALMLTVIGCEHLPVEGVFNREEEQDQKCLDSYGGLYGYCGRVVDR